jgi:phosphatidylinositol alpha-1,6-mannosyltransferase
MATADTGSCETSRIVLLAEAFPPAFGGSGRWFWESYRRLDWPALRVVTTHRSDAPAFDASTTLRIDRISLSLRETGSFSWTGMRGYWSIVSHLRRLHAASPVSIVHCARCITEGWAGWLFWRLTGVPYLCYIHGEDVNWSPDGEQLGVMSSCQHRWMARRVLRNAGHLIANSHNTRRILETVWGISPDRITVVHPGVDTKRFSPADRSAKSRAALGWHDRPVILTVGRLQKRKGHDMLIRALPRIQETLPDVLYVVAGEGEERGRLESLVRELGVRDLVQFRTTVDDDELLTLYQQCDLFALPNRAVGHDIEGFGMVLLEAQSCGKPIVAGDSGGTREAFVPGETGWLVDCTTPERLIQTITEAFSDRPKLDSMGRRGAAWARAEFDWECVVGKMQSAFECCGQ